MKHSKQRTKFNPENVFFTADLHFAHQNIIQDLPRPFSNLEVMTDRLIENWNLKITTQDYVFVLGDFYFGKDMDELEDLVGDLNGHKYLIKGNHDPLDPHTYKFIGFEDFVDYAEIVVNHQLIVLSHYPMLSWNCSHYGSWMLHGHTHGILEKDYEWIKERAKLGKNNPVIGKLSMDVGVDNPRSGFGPFSFQEIKEYFDELTKI